MNTVVTVLYLIASILFILGLKMLTRVPSARHGNWLSSSAMLVAVLATMIQMEMLGKVSYTWIIAGLVLGAVIGLIMAIKVQMTAMPEMVAIFNGFGGGASALVASSIMYKEGWVFGSTDNTITLYLSILIGGVTFTGSIIAFGKLKGIVSGKPIMYPGNHLVNLVLVLGTIGIIVLVLTGVEPGQDMNTPLSLVKDPFVATLIAVGIALVLGVLLVIPIGGADMPVVISLLNSYSGLAAASAGFVLQNNVLIISGALVGASGLILTQIMCKAMNRSLANVLFGGFGQEPVAGPAGSSGKDAYQNVKSCTPEEAAMILESATDVIIVPGYGLAVAQAQHITKEFGDELAKRGANVRYAIHPVAGRMPGHMNVLLAESNVPFEQLLDLDQINEDFKNADVALILGANDVVNPAALTEKDSPIYGMPVLKVWEAKTTFVVKRSLSPGFAAIPNDLFNRDNNLMMFGDAKKIMTELNHELKEL